MIAEIQGCAALEVRRFVVVRSVFCVEKSDVEKATPRQLVQDLRARDEANLSPSVNIAGLVLVAPEARHGGERDGLFNHLLHLALDVAHLAGLVARQQIDPDGGEVHAAELICDLNVRVLPGCRSLLISPKVARAAEGVPAHQEPTLLPSASVSYVKVNV